MIVTLVGHGCPIPAIEAAFGIPAQTVRDWLDAAGVHCETVQQQVVQPRDLHQVQADEIRVTTQAGILWVAMAMMVTTRLWRGGVVSPRRDRTLIQRLADLMAACAQWGPVLLVTDGLSTYVEAFRSAFRTRPPGTGGRPRLVIWPDLVIAQVIKPYAGHAVTGTIHRLVHGSVRLFLTFPVSGAWHTSLVEVSNPPPRGEEERAITSSCKQKEVETPMNTLLYSGHFCFSTAL